MDIKDNTILKYMYARITIRKSRILRFGLGYAKGWVSKILDFLGFLDAIKNYIRT